MRLTLHYRSIQPCYISLITLLNDSLSKSEDNQYTSSEEMKRLKVKELKTILSDHGQPGRKADLVHSFLVSFSSVFSIHF